MNLNNEKIASSNRHQSHTVIGQVSCCDICGDSFHRKSHTQYKCVACSTNDMTFVSHEDIYGYTIIPNSSTRIGIEFSDDSKYQKTQHRDRCVECGTVISRYHKDSFGLCYLCEKKLHIQLLS